MVKIFFNRFYHENGFKPFDSPDRFRYGFLPCFSHCSAFAPAVFSDLGEEEKEEKRRPAVIPRPLSTLR